MAREGALISILYLEEHDDAAARPRGWSKRKGASALLFAGDVGDEMFCWESVERTVRGIRPHRHSGQQRRRAARGRRSGRARRRAARAHVPHQRVQLLPHDARLPAVHAAGREHHQHDLDHGLSRPQDADRLRRHQGRDRVADALAVAGAGRQGHPRQRRCAGTDLDAADPGLVRCREGREARRERADGARRPAERSRALLRVPRQRGRLLHQRARCCIRTAAAS